MRLPFFYGWIIVAVTFVTMAIGVNARTSFSLFFPPIIDEFGWERGVTAGAFSFGFLISGAMSPLIGRMMDRFGPRVVMELGVALMGGGLLLAPLTTQPWHLYLTIGVMVGAGSVCLGYSGQSLFLPNWFIRRRGLAMGIAFAGVGIGSVTLLPWVQHMIEETGWRTACTAMGLLRGQPARHPRPDPARTRFRPGGARMDLDGKLFRLCDLLCVLDRAEICTHTAAGLPDGIHARRARLRLDLDHGRGGARDFPGPALRQHLRHHHARGIGRRRRGPMDHGRSARSDRQLHACLCDRNCRELVVCDRDLAGRTSKNPRGGRPIAPPAKRERLMKFSSGRGNSDRPLQIGNGAQEAVGRRGLRIDQAVQPKAVLQD